MVYHGSMSDKGISLFMHPAGKKMHEMTFYRAKYNWHFNGQVSVCNKTKELGTYIKLDSFRKSFQEMNRQSKIKMCQLFFN